MDVMLTLASNKPLGDGVAPDRSRVRSEFPYFGEPYTSVEQVGVTPSTKTAKEVMRVRNFPEEPPYTPRSPGGAAT